MTLKSSATAQRYRRLGALHQIRWNPFRITVLTNCLALVLLTFWIAADPSAETAAENSISISIEMWLHGSAESMPPPLPRTPTRNVGPIILVFVACASLLATGGMLFFGVSKQSRLGRWLIFVALCAAWLGLANGIHDLAWFGKRIRFVDCVPKMQHLADGLRRDWPTSDGHLDGLGPFMAYPVYEPKTLLLLTPPRLKTWDEQAISVVERASGGGLRFQLADTNPSASSNSNDWLEWHPLPNVPTSFTGGLRDRHQLRQTSSFGDGWFLARYESPERSGKSTIRREKVATRKTRSIDFD